MHEETDPVKKIVIVGDGGCGKTCLLHKYVSKEFLSDYCPTVFDRSEIPYIDELTKRRIRLDLWDTAGQEDYDRIRTLSYLDTDLIIVCFALNSKKTFVSVGDRWKDEIEHFCKNTPKILVGMKADLRTKEDQNLIPTKKAIDMAKQISAKGYIECSAYTGENVEEVFDMTMDILLERKRKRKSKK
ncbi:hypothetical protein NEDG_02002 [Nematocida displodere]|uniref:Ras-like protein family, member A n=1 Tax=Nematocida displodere TaxID=1805483 RepID=A0A177EGC2_9MICR|nr:hypothetical protein NEDG_02002 [Nematocida displodere]